MSGPSSLAYGYVSYALLSRSHYRRTRFQSQSLTSHYLRLNPQSLRRLALQACDAHVSSPSPNLEGCACWIILFHLFRWICWWHLTWALYRSWPSLERSFPLSNHFYKGYHRRSRSVCASVTAAARTSLMILNLFCPVLIASFGLLFARWASLTPYPCQRCWLTCGQGGRVQFCLA